jgi:mannose-6-phosphate isomerase-like protein (cupin superfamily)
MHTKQVVGRFGVAEDLEMLASRLAEHATNDLDGTLPWSVVILGEAPGVPGWASAHSAMADALALTVPAGRTAADVVQRYLSEKGALGGRFFWCAYPMIQPGKPPLGYDHLANLAAKGRVDLVLTTSWDPLLEIAFSKVLGPAQYRVLTRGEIGDLEFARALLQRGIPQIVKLNGDLHSALVTCAGGERGSFSATPAIADALHRIFADAMVIADVSEHEEPGDDVASLVTMAARAGLVYEVGHPANGHRSSSWFMQNTRVADSTVTDFDVFMIELDRQVELAIRRRPDPHSQLIRDEMIRSLELGAASVTSAATAGYVQELAEELTNSGTDWIAYIDDPIAPGGTEVWRRLARTPTGALPSLRISIVTDSSNRVVNRRAVVPRAASVPAGARVAVVDSVGFSGNTLRMAMEALASRFDGLDIFPAVLVASKYLVEKSENGEKWLDRLVYRRATERHDISFPWGTTFATDTVVRHLQQGHCRRSIEVFRRPWGSGEVFATAENCSVRILAIDASQKLSFQRHLCRDEFFIALDDGVGIDLSGDELEDGVVDEFDYRIDSVTLEYGDYLFVPRGVWHRVRGSRTRVRVLEIAFGVYDEDFDIERLLDLYGRARDAG